MKEGCIIPSWGDNNNIESAVCRARIRELKKDFDKQMEMVLYHSDEGNVSVDAYIKDESIWITQKAMALLFDVNVPDISKHLSNIYDEGELTKEATIS